MSSRAMRMHGEYLLGEGADPKATLERGCENVKRHIHNLVTHYATPVIVAITRSNENTPEELALLERVCVAAGAHACVPFFGWSTGSEGSERLARAVLSVTEAQKSTPQLKQLYSLEDSVSDKIRSIATKIYGATDIELSPKAKVQCAQPVPEWSARLTFPLLQKGGN